LWGTEKEKKGASCARHSHHAWERGKRGSERKAIRLLAQPEKKKGSEAPPTKREEKGEIRMNEKKP